MPVPVQQRIQQAVALHQAGRLDAAGPIYADVLREAPHFHPALHLLGSLRYQQGRLDEALALMERALTIQPGAPETLVNYALALDAAGRRDAALAALDQALKARPHHARSWNNHGTILGKCGRVAEALRDFDKAVALDPRDAEIRNNRGIALRQAGRGREALADFDHVLSLRPRHVGVLLNRAGTLVELGQMETAHAAYDAVLALDPDHAAALASRGALLSRLKQMDRAIADLEKAYRLKPDTPHLLGNLVHARRTAGDWRAFDRDTALLDDAVRAGADVDPFAYQAVSDSPENLQRCARRFSARNFPPAPAVFTQTVRKPGRIRVGYVCGEFRTQATMILSAGLYEAHDRDRFEVFAFDNGGSDGSPLRHRLEAAFGRILPIAALSDTEAARQVAAADIDILVSLNGYFGGQRTGLFAQRAAPLQVNYLGFPGTLGAPYIDYILADETVLPGADAYYYDERVAWLPDSYQINDNKRARPRPDARAAHGLPDAAFVFCNFNFSYKITPAMFAAWLRLLRDVPGSVLWLLQDNDSFAANLRETAKRAGIDPARLIFASLAAPDAHLSRLALADLVLDCLPYNAHTTASDALWAGVPLVTCRGSAFAGRVGASLLQAMGLDELIADDIAGYESLAVALARDPARLAALRRRLARSYETAPLFDTARTTRHIEAAYTTMLDRWEQGLSPESFRVPAQPRSPEDRS